MIRIVSFVLLIAAVALSVTGGEKTGVGLGNDNLREIRASEPNEAVKKEKNKNHIDREKTNKTRKKKVKTIGNRKVKNNKIAKEKGKPTGNKKGTKNKTAKKKGKPIGNRKGNKNKKAKKKGNPIGNRKAKKNKMAKKKGKTIGNRKGKNNKIAKKKGKPIGNRKGIKNKRAKKKGKPIGNRKGNKSRKAKKKGNPIGNRKVKKNKMAKKKDKPIGNKKGNKNKTAKKKGQQIEKYIRNIKGNKSKTGGKKSKEIRKFNRQTCDVSTTCFETAVNFLKIWKDTVINFEQQRNRMTKQNKTGGKKSGKKGLFAPVVQRLVEAGGGNKSNLSCNGNYKNAGAKQLKNLTMILHGCELKINASCNPANFPKPNITKLNECKSLDTSFKTKAASCLKETAVSTACSCWTNSTLSKTVQALKSCKFSTESKAVTAQLRQCTGNFSICRKFEDDTITAIMACSKSTSQLLAKAKSLTSNKNEMTKAKEKLSSLSGSTSGRIRRATATKCSEIISKSKIITSLASDSPSNDRITTLSKEISSASVTCTSTEIISIKIEEASMTSNIATITVALETVQTNLQTITGSTASSTAIAASDGSATTSQSSTAKSSTAKASGRRNMLIRDAMNRVQKMTDLTN